MLGKMKAMDANFTNIHKARSYFQHCSASFVTTAVKLFFDSSNKEIPSRDILSLTF